MENWNRNRKAETENKKLKAETGNGRHAIIAISMAGTSVMNTAILQLMEKWFMFLTN